MNNQKNLRLKPLILQLALIGTLVSMQSAFAEIVCTPSSTNASHVLTGGANTFKFTCSSSTVQAVYGGVMFGYNPLLLDASLTTTTPTVKCGTQANSLNAILMPFDFFPQQICEVSTTVTPTKDGTYTVPVFSHTVRQSPLAGSNTSCSPN